MRCLREVLVSLAILVLMPLGAEAQEEAAGEAVPEQAEQPEEPPTDARLEEARSLFERGIELTDDERWAEALEYFRRSRAIFERPSTIFNMAVALFRLGRYQEAVTAFDDYLAASSGDDPARQTEARRYLEQMEANLGRLTLSVTPPEATVLVDGVPVAGTGTRRQLHLDPGSRNITIEADGYRTRRLSLSVLEGQVHERSVVLESVDQSTILGVETNVGGAVIRIDGRDVGRGSAELEVVPGPHEVEIVADGYLAYSEDVDVQPGARHLIDAVLQREGGGSIFATPWPWVVLGVVIAGAAAVTVGILVAQSNDPLQDYDGTTGVVLEALTW